MVWVCLTQPGFKRLLGYVLTPPLGLITPETSLRLCSPAGPSVIHLEQLVYDMADTLGWGQGALG